MSYESELIERDLVHEVHVSERRSFRGCRRRWNWVFREWYYPPLTPKPLEFGVAYHRAMEVLHNPTTWRFTPLVLGALAEKAFVESCESQRKAYLRARRLFCLEGEELEDYDERVRLGRGMIRYYVSKQLPAIQAEFTPTHVEVSFKVPIRHIGNAILLCKCKHCREAFAKAGGGRWKGNPVVFAGRVDMIVRDISGDYWVWDFKTATRFLSSDTVLELDDQVLGYVYALRVLLGLNIRGFLYHEQRKAFPEPPNENKVLREGRRFSVNKQQPTDYITYRDHVAEHDREAYLEGLYEDHLNWLKLENYKYYQRFKIIKTPYELQEYGRNLLMETLDMLDPNLRIYPAPGRFACATCAYQSPCLSQNAGQDYQYALNTLYEKRLPYYRLEENRRSTESRGGELCHSYHLNQQVRILSRLITFELRSGANIVDSSQLVQRPYQTTFS